MLITVAIVGVASMTTFFSLSQLNYYATTTRLYTTALAVAQEEIDAILTKEPFDPPRNLVPKELELGTHAPKTAFIYKDPNTGEILVSGTLNSTLTDSPATMIDSSAAVVNMKLRRALVRVTYRFRNRDYSVVMNTIRAWDE